MIFIFKLQARFKIVFKHYTVLNNDYKIEKKHIFTTKNEKPKTISTQKINLKKILKKKLLNIAIFYPSLFVEVSCTAWI